MDFSSPFLTKQIIAYIGNKRRLLGLIYRAVEECIPGAKDGLRFFDAFSGSGIVSRLAKTLNFELFTNDWEHYSYILSQAFIATNASDMPALFGGWEKFHCLADTLNHLPPPAENEQYIAQYYAPTSTNIDHADFRTERLFYTHDNALRIDKIRNYIDAHFPAGHGQARQLLIGLLLYEAATHTNTSGVFKAFHKGFGGHGRDALKRILTPVQIRPPALIDSPYPVHVFQADANMLAKELGAGKIDIAYLDPPYNQHQYGSNYHMLNTIALWDKPPAPTTLNAEGVLKAKAGIRQDWIKTRSAYCYADSAVRAFRDLVHNLNARYILISYSTDGLIPFDLMMEVCAARGALKVVTDGYTTYRGGRQSNARLNSNMEFVLIIDTARLARPAHARAVYSALARQKLLLLFRRRYSRARLRANFQVGGIGSDSSDRIDSGAGGADRSGGGGGSGDSGTDSSDNSDGFQIAGSDSIDRSDDSDGFQIAGTDSSAGSDSSDSPDSSAGIDRSDDSNGFQIAGSDGTNNTDSSDGTDNTDNTDSSDGTDGQALIFHLPGRQLKIYHTDFFELHPPPELNDLTNDESAALLTALQNSICQTREEELVVVLDMITGHGMLNVRNGDAGGNMDTALNAVTTGEVEETADGNADPAVNIDGNAEAGLKYIRLLPPILRKLAHKKNRERFYHFLSRVKELEKLQPALYQSIKDKIKTTEELAEKRFEN